MNPYHLSSDQIFESVASSANGLSKKEASDRLAKNGPNALAQAPKPSLFARFMAQLKDPMVIVLIAAAAVSAVTSAYSGESFVDTIIILAVVLINAVLGVVQEGKAEAAIESLQQMSAAMCKVLRGGEVVMVKSEEIVVGDVILLEAGDAVPADGRIIEAASLQIEEAALTGESVPANKHADVLEGEGDVPLGDRKNMAYMGTSVVYGRARMVVTACGMDTQMGKIANVLNDAKDNKTPLQEKLAQLSRVLSFLVLGVSAFIFVFTLIRGGEFTLDSVLSAFMIAVSLAVAAIPEGLSAVVTVVLSIGVTNMSKNNAIIRKLTAVETLGCAQIICSDKTGTLTQNKMTVVDEFTSDSALLATAMALCSDANLDHTNVAVGEPTECALVNHAFKVGLPKHELQEKTPRVAEAPFDSMRKMMSTVHACDNGFIQYTKGGLDEVLSRCVKIYDNGQVRDITDEDRDAIIAKNKEFAARALRVLSAAYRTYDALPQDTSPEALEQELTYIGIVGMIDPVRPEVKAAIERCKDAGVRAIMITGDHRDTAIAIATELGIINSPEQAITGADLEEMTDEYLDAHIQDFGVYARVQPEHKTRIVSAWQKLGKITAMTGDGVNDAPSIKTANIGVGMGITGTDVTKDVADMVLADDNFATIVSAVGEGRRIYDNIRKAIQFLLASNASEVITIFMATLLGFVVLEPVHLLWINLITDTFPAIALGMEEAEPDVMNRPPRNPKEGIFAGGMGQAIIYQALAVSILTLGAYLIGHYMESGVWEFVTSEHGMTMAFITLSLTEIVHSFNMRSRTQSLFSIKKQNKVLWLAGLASFVLTIAVAFIPPFARAFSLAAISLKELAVAVGLALIMLPIVELEKFFSRREEK
ncbi:MAG: cation-translocating P-type ATPase [Clostridia bacterium]|nr:cation-translocating P-type ATPase [Clostridia bacterium]